jgi:hypothetical protein
MTDYFLEQLTRALFWVALVYLITLDVLETIFTLEDTEVV